MRTRGHNDALAVEDDERRRGTRRRREKIKSEREGNVRGALFFPASLPAL